MKGKWTVFGTVLLVVLLALALTVSPGRAQGPGPQGDASIQAALGTAFTYQGQLKSGGNPVNGTCDFQFSLWDAASGGTQIGAIQTKTNVAVSNGLFTVQLDFGAGAFQGDGRWLAVAVRCPAGSGTYTPLSPRQALTAAPYALALPGLWTQQNATSPNLIGGYSGNSVTGGVYGATIGGGGSSGNVNRVTDDYGTVGGGLNNRAGDYDANTTDVPYATVGGGYYNTASGYDATVGGGAVNTASGGAAAVGGGSSNTASGDWATVGGGNSNTASGSSATVGGGAVNTASGGAAAVGGGRSNTASGYDATVGGGNSNTASGSSATVGGGLGNTASGGISTVGGGRSNTASGYDATVGGGYSNAASGEYATVPGGLAAAATHYGEMAYASGRFAASGDAQTSVYVLRRTSSDIITSTLFLDGSVSRLTIASGRTLTFDILVVGRSATGESAGYQIRGVIENVGGTTAIVGLVSKTNLAEDDATWDVTVDADDPNDALRIRVQGGAGDSVRWVATVRTVEVSW